MLQDTYPPTDADSQRSTKEIITFLKNGNAVPPDVFSKQTTLAMSEAKQEMDTRVEAAKKNRLAVPCADAFFAAAVYRDLLYIANGRKAMKLLGYHGALAQDCSAAGAQR